MHSVVQVIREGFHVIKQDPVYDENGESCDQMTCMPGEIITGIKNDHKP
jgi:hypothetical protein